MQVITFLSAVFDKEGIKVDKERMRVEEGAVRAGGMSKLCPLQLGGGAEHFTWDTSLLCGHKIKEINPGVTDAMNSLSCPMRIGLTGTAVQNKYEELWCILDWANPGSLRSVKPRGLGWTPPRRSWPRLG